MMPARLISLLGVLVSMAALSPCAATVLTSGSFSTVSGGGQTGAAAETTCMIMSDGNSWSGGAAGVQGRSSTNVYGLNPLAANIAFKFDIGDFVDSLNSTYGVGNWSVANIQLEFQYTLYANNPRFGGGAGSFSIYWVANDEWVQGANNPVYATSAEELLPWGQQISRLGDIEYAWSTPTYTGTTGDLGDWTTDKSGGRQSTSVIGLGSTDGLLEPILTASSAGDSSISLYLMATSDSLGLTIFTGGGGPAGMLPTLSFDVVSVPEPATFGMLACAAFYLTIIRKRRPR